MMMSEETVRRLAADRPQVTGEIHTANNFYGHDQVLKKYCGHAPDYQLKAVVEHGVFLNDPVRYIWEADRQAPLPVFLAASKAHADYVTETTDKVGIPVGPMIMYALPFVPEPQAHCAGRVLAVPVHSSHHVIANTDEEDFVRRIDSCGVPRSQVSVLLYWKDILLGHDSFYREKGFGVLTAGHIFSNGFLYLFAEIMQNHDLIVTNAVGTHVFYAALMQKPVWIVPGSTVFTTQGRPYCIYRSPVERRVRELFGSLRDALTDEQREYVNELTGVASFRTPDRLRDLLDFAEFRHRGGAQRLRRSA
ncbi:hypothetical protein [Oleidesulfovibrio alaskensis]|jgi:hypothetical protein|uniref:hypothetical protein n=1 Tax=Oleidesulfovibrio alaskensis TaxID=58180 RepID=UPI00040FED03|nr:hypothetical protein [Oleidesulfovibrio alaskensis]